MKMKNPVDLSRLVPDAAANLTALRACGAEAGRPGPLCDCGNGGSTPIKDESWCLGSGRLAMNVADGRLRRTGDTESQ